MIPAFDKKKAQRAGRPTDGPESCARRKVGLLHQCFGALLKGWDALTLNRVKPEALPWADGVWRRTMFFFRGLFADQPECDSYCCDTSQSCKICVCPKNMLHLPGIQGASGLHQYQPKLDYKVQASVDKAAKGVHNNGRPLFQILDPGPVWRATVHCSKSAYERARTNTSGVHIMPNAFWNLSGFDVQQMVTYSICI